MSLLDQQFPSISSCFGFQKSLTPRGLSHQASSDSLTSLNETRKKEIDAVLSEAMTNLTFEERQEHQKVLHGVDDQREEEASFIDNALQQLDNHLLQTKSGSVYQTAESMDPNYVGARSFRIMFLRGNRYDTKAAADQMLRFFQIKQEIFGSEKLVKDITVADLDEDDMACLKTGFMQVIGRDSSKREIVFEPSSLRSFKMIQNELRARYYILMSMLKSEETQLRGAVAIPYNVGDFRDRKGTGGFLQTVRLTTAIPLFSSAIHFCCSTSAGYVLFNVAIKAMPAKLKARFRIHCGSHMEVAYKLSTFGIPIGLLPLAQDTNTIILDPHLAWCQSRLTTDNPNRSTRIQPIDPTQPNANDVLYLDGKTSNNMGNNRLRCLVKELETQYQSGSNEEKRQVVEIMIAEIHKSGGRFLREANGPMNPIWQEVPLSDVRGRVKQMFRNFKRRHDASQRKRNSGTLISGEPLPSDVIFGGKANKCRGNVKLRQLVKDRMEEYDALDRGLKSGVVEAIFQQIKCEGGRFLHPTQDSTGWVEVSNEAARERISRSFRNNRRYASK